MKPDINELNEEIRGPMALSVKERNERGAAPEVALKELGADLLAGDSTRRVWWHRLLGEAEALARDLRFALRSLLRAKGLTITVVVTLALGIGANAAIFSVVRSVLLKPLVNRDADRLIYIRQIAPGIGSDNFRFSIVEIAELEERVKKVVALGEFSTVDFTFIGFGKDPRNVKAGVVSGSYFDVMGLRPILGRLVNAGDDGPSAEGVVVLTHRFWTTALNSDPSVVGKTILLGRKTATVIGVLEPFVPYPEETQIIANISTSPHHLGATMEKDRWHRMTEVFGRLEPGVTLEAARAELQSVHASILREHPKAYSDRAQIQLRVTTLRDQLASPARTILLLLLAAAAIVFVIACSNVANLILARSVRRETELAVRSALGASRRALRRTLLAESLVLCAAGAMLGLLLAAPLMTVVARYASRFSVRALDTTLDASVLWLGAGLAVAAAVLLAYVPRLPLSDRAGGSGRADRKGNFAISNSLSGSVRMTPGTNRRLRIFATIQIACSFVLLAGAGMLVATLTALQTANSVYDMRQVLAVDIPLPSTGVGGAAALDFFREATRRVGDLPGVQGVAAGMIVPWRDPSDGLTFQFGFDGYQPAAGEESPACRFRPISTGFFAVLGIPIIAGREFTNEDRQGNELVAIVSQSVAQRMFPNGDAINGRMWWNRQGVGQPRRIVGVVADADDMDVVQKPAMTVYQPLQQMGNPVPNRLFVRAAGDPYALVPSVRRAIREIDNDKAIERPATLQDVRAEVLTPERLNAFVFSAFGGIALLVAVVGVAGVLAFSVSTRTRELGIRLALGSTPSQLLTRILKEGAVIVTVGITAGAVFGYVLARVASTYLGTTRMPGALPAFVAAAVLLVAAVIASLIPAARASRVNVLEALRSE